MRECYIRLESTVDAQHERMSQKKNLHAAHTKTFAELCYAEAGILAKKKGRPAEPFTQMEYADECLVKQQALDRFFREQGLGPCEKMVPAPGGRHYRNTSKRRLKIINARPRLICDSDDPDLVSRLETLTHAKIFALCESMLTEIPRKILDTVNFCILRGSAECALIFNMARVDRQTVHILTKISQEIQAGEKSLQSAFIFHDPSRSKYYLEAEALQENSFKRLFGPRVLRYHAKGLTFQYHPLSFSQVNTPVAEIIASRIDSFFSTENETLVDLYCGYGFFSCIAGDSFSNICGIDCARESIASAKENAAHACRKTRSGFFLRSIDAAALQQILSPIRTRISMILDPPRKGCERGVIANCASFRPDKVAHLFCGAEQIASECAQWEKGGYAIDSIIPYDMFAGTAAIETLVLLKQKK